MKKIKLIIPFFITILILTSCRINITTKNAKDEKVSQSNSNLALSVQNTEYNASNDGSYLVLGDINKSKGFMWCQSEDNLSDNYFEGTYSCFTGEDGFKFVTTVLKPYGVTRDELEKATTDKSKFIVLYVKYDDIIIDGKSEIESWNNDIDKNNPKTCAYYGTISDNGDLSLVNMLTATPYSFIKKDNLKTDSKTTDNSNFETPSSDSSDYMKELKMINYNIPEDYTMLNQGYAYTLYVSGDDTLTIFFVNSKNLDSAKKDDSNGTELKVDGHNAYKYKYQGKFCISILGNDGEYVIEATNEKALNELVNSITF